MTTGEMHEDGSITLPPNPWGTAATWADYDWRRLAREERGRADGIGRAAATVFDLIADAVAAGVEGADQ